MEGLALEGDAGSLHVLVMMADFIRTNEIDFIDLVEGTSEWCPHCFSQWSRKQGYQLKAKSGETGDRDVFKYLSERVVEGNDQGKDSLAFSVSMVMCFL